MQHMYEEGLSRRDANYAAMTPVDLLARTAEVYPERLAIVHGSLRQTWGETYLRCLRLADSLVRLGIRRGDTVALLLPNIPAMIEAHFGIPMAGGVLNTLNTRLDAESIVFMLRHGEAKILIVDTEYAATARAVSESLPDLVIVAVADIDTDGTSLPAAVDYERLVAEGSQDFVAIAPEDEWDAIALNYTSGTTGEPKGVVYHHRGAYLNAVSNVLAWDMPRHSVYLWTLPLFHCNGWCFAWTLAERAGVNVCLRKFDVETVFRLIIDERVTHYCGAPVVQSALANAPEELRKDLVHTISTMSGGAPPPPSLIAELNSIGIQITHVYGLTEVYGPTSICVGQDSWKRENAENIAVLNARQGVRYPLQSGVTVLDPQTMTPVPRDGKTMGEIMVRGNICMKGYLKSPEATSTAFLGGWFHSGDLAVIDPDGYIKIRDRSKDIIISGGENISSIEVEDALYRHEAVAMAAVIAMPDERWGEVPCAFIELRDGMHVTAEELVTHCRKHLAGFKIPKAIHFQKLPQTSTGKIQKHELRMLHRASGQSVGATGAQDFDA